MHAVSLLSNVRNGSFPVAIIDLVHLQPACDMPFDDGVSKVARFSLHAGVAARVDARKKLERPYRYISRPVLSGKWMSLTSIGSFVYWLKTPYCNGSTHVAFERGCLPPPDLIARLAVLAGSVRNCGSTSAASKACPHQTEIISL